MESVELAGVSLVALLRREPGPLVVRHKPSGLAPDPRVQDDSSITGNA
ncbi:MAG: hypothetical protein LLF97_04115 [Planctomycetaceae bacterium]|nr:hypothetical protein [Planctomycetaceae bacterium]